MIRLFEPVDQDKMRRSCHRAGAVEDQHGRQSFNRAEREPPFRLFRIAREIEANLVAPLQLQAVDQIELHVIGEHGADRVEIAAPKQIDISRDLPPVRIGHQRQPGVFGRLRESAQRSAPALKRRFGGCLRALGDACDLVDRMTQNILEDHRAALQFGQSQKRLKADRDDVRLGYRRRFDVFGERNDRIPGPVAQEIEARVVGDAKQPALEIIDPGALRSRLKGLDEGILQHILAVDRRSRHARAVAMQAWPQRLQTILEFVGVHVSRPTASALCSAKDWTPMSMRIFDRVAGCARNGEWLLTNVWMVVLPPMAPSTVAIM